MKMSNSQSQVIFKIDSIKTTLTLIHSPSILWVCLDWFIWVYLL